MKYTVVMQIEVEHAAHDLMGAVEKAEGLVGIPFDLLAVNTVLGGMYKDEDGMWVSYISESV